jgi:dipeptidyl aminopeptidase/acylaminoacyl peptidase
MRAGLLLCLFLAAGEVVAAAPTIEEIYGADTVGGVAVSPDGARVAYTLGGEIRVVQIDGSRDRAWAKGSAPAWSPDGERLAFLAADDGARQIWSVAAAGDEARQLTHHDGFIDRFLWSPDGGRIAFLARPENQRDLRYLVYHTTPGEPTIVDVNNLPRNRLWLVDQDGGEARALTGEDYSVGGYEQWFADGYSWSPDGRSIAFSKRPHAKAGSHLEGDVALVDVATGEVRTTVQRPGMDGYPQWSPLGDKIGFITTERHDWVTVSHLYTIDPKTGRTEKLTPEFDEKINEFFWADGGRRILYLAGQGVSTQLFSVDLAGRRVDQLTSGNEVRGGLSVSLDGSTAAWVQQSAAEPPAVYAARPAGSKPRRITDPGAEFAAWPRVETEIVHWQSFDGMEIEGLLHKPVGYREGRRYPLLVIPHGGPHAAMTNVYVSGETRVFAQRGWLVFRPNFRGSGHYGEKFLRANLGGWGVGDYQDVMTGVDELIERGLADPDRMAMAGASYGGYMTSWTISQTDRFRAAVIGAPITNVESFIGTTDVPQRFQDYLGKYPAAYARSSPMHFANNLKTPSLIWHGDGDIRVPLMQGLQLYTALSQNGAPTEMLIYRGEAHGLRDKEHILDLIHREVEWLERWTLGERGKD